MQVIVTNESHYEIHPDGSKTLIAGDPSKNLTCIPRRIDIPRVKKGGAMKISNGFFYAWMMLTNAIIASVLISTLFN